MIFIFLPDLAAFNYIYFEKHLAYFPNVMGSISGLGLFLTLQLWSWRNDGTEWERRSKIKEIYLWYCCVSHEYLLAWQLLRATDVGLFVLMAMLLSHIFPSDDNLPPLPAEAFWWSPFLWHGPLQATETLFFSPDFGGSTAYMQCSCPPLWQ